MLTCPCVTIEWNTPAIQTVEVSPASSGVRPLPERSMWPWGRSTCSSLAFRTTWRRSPAKNDSRRPSASRSSCRRSVPNRPSISASREIERFQQRGGAEQAGAGRALAGGGGPFRGWPGLRQRQGSVDESEVGIRRGGGMVAPRTSRRSRVRSARPVAAAPLRPESPPWRARAGGGCRASLPSRLPAGIPRGWRGRGPEARRWRSSSRDRGPRSRTTDCGLPWTGSAGRPAPSPARDGRAARGRGTGSRSTR